MPGGQNRENAAKSLHSDAHRQPHSRAVDSQLRIESRCKFAQPNVKLGNDKSQTDDGSAGPHPGKASALDRERFGAFVMIGQRRVQRHGGPWLDCDDFSPKAGVHCRMLGHVLLEGVDGMNR